MNQYTNPNERSISLDDPREIRRLIDRVRWSGERLDGKSGKYPQLNFVKPVLDAAQYRGFSGEDAMTILAYHALLQVERLMDDALELAMCSPMPPVLFSGMYARSNSDGGILRVCPVNDIECGHNSQNWCDECPNRISKPETKP